VDGHVLAERRDLLGKVFARFVTKALDPIEESLSRREIEPFNLIVA